jgi:alginate O-acetyltransferase complex protein AlgI
MLLALLAALLLAPVYWLVVPARWRRDAITLVSVLALGWYDLRLGVGLIVAVAGIHLALRAMSRLAGRRRWLIAAPGLILLTALFLLNKLGQSGGGALASQSGLAFLGVSYFVLKGAAVLSDVATGSRAAPGARGLLAWIAFLPTYPSGPIEDLDHFTAQEPALDTPRIGWGLQRIIFGLVKALVLSHYLGEWANTHLLDLDGSSSLEVLFATWAFTFRFFLDFSGYSDIAIGLAAVYGWEIQENFDRPLLRRNLVLLWQNWHITLTRWLRVYLFVPISRMVMRRGGERFDAAAIVIAQVVSMTFCGLWHGLSWNFALWGLLQALGLVWVGLVAGRVGRFVPSDLREWWRTSSLAFALSVFITFNAFSLSNVLVHSTFDQALRVGAHLLPF